MARKPNYDFEKRRKEAERKAKQDAKRDARRERQRLEAEGELPPEEAPAGSGEDSQPA